MCQNSDKSIKCIASGKLFLEYLKVEMNYLNIVKFFKHFKLGPIDNTKTELKRKQYSF